MTHGLPLPLQDALSEERAAATATESKITEPAAAAGVHSLEINLTVRVLSCICELILNICWGDAQEIEAAGNKGTYVHIDGAMAQFASFDIAGYYGINIRDSPVPNVSSLPQHPLPEVPNTGLLCRRRSSRDCTLTMWTLTWTTASSSPST